MFIFNKRNTQSRRRYNVFILTSEHNSHSFRVTIADFKQENIYLDSFLELWNFNYLHRFFSNNKCCCKVHVHATLLLKTISNGMFQKEANFFLYVWGMLDEKQLGLLRGISHSPRCCWYVRSLLYSFCVYMIKSDDALTEIQFSQPDETVMRMLMYQFRLRKS